MSSELVIATVRQREHRLGLSEPVQVEADLAYRPRLDDKRWMLITRLAERFDTAELCPPRRLNGYRNPLICRHFASKATTGIEPV
ncbi:MAG TPA: hypothetical protein VNY52_00265 [Solirubrobacteraceae bacterium]|jgi:hypothetical protein|nr:hypothetical protein [Solirubrobacteraceae bacterium]